MGPEGKHNLGMKTRELLRYAKSLGIEVVNRGHGRHKKYLVSPDGDSRPVPDHGSRKRFAPGTLHDLIDFIRAHGSQEERL